MDFLTLLTVIVGGIFLAILIDGALLIVQDKEQEFQQRKSAKNKEH